MNKKNESMNEESKNVKVYKESKRLLVRLELFAIETSFIIDHAKVD